MKKFRRIITLLAFTLLLTNCGKEKLKLNEEVTLTGEISTREITTEDGTKKVSILNLEEPVIIDGNTIHKIEIDYDKALKNNQEITITGVIKENESGDYKYSFSVADIDDILSYINTFNSDEFSITIPVELIKIVSIEKIDNGFAIYISSDSKGKVESFRAISVTTDEYKELQKENGANIELAKSSGSKKVVLIFNSDELPDDTLDVQQEINSKIHSIKKGVQIK